MIEYYLKYMQLNDVNVYVYNEFEYEMIFDKTNDDEKRFRGCSRKRAFPTLDCVLLYRDYYSFIYAKPFGYYACRWCLEFHIFTIR